MDVQQFLAVNLMALSAILIMASLIQQPLKGSGAWLAVNAAVIVAGALALQWQERWAGAIVAGLFCPFVLAPVVLGNLAQRWLRANKLSRAATAMRVAALLHPAARLRFAAALITAQAHEPDEANIAALRQLASSATPAQQAVIKAAIYRLADDWPGLLAELRRRPAATEPDRDTIAFEIRALGETGRIDEMVRVYEAAKAHLPAAYLQDSQLFVLAFCGRPVEVRHLLSHQMAAFDDDIKTYWTAIAERAAAGSDSGWRAALGTLARASASSAIRKQAERRLAIAEPPERERLSGAATAILDATAARIREQQPRLPRGPFSTPVTFALMALILAGYAVEEMSGGAQNLRVLTNLGAMWPPDVLGRGQWWRLGTALFLHFGLLHIGINTFMLYVLGRATETEFGSWRMLLVYALGGLTSSGFVLWLMANGYTRHAVLMGASGAIMALFGAIVARRLVTWARTRDIRDRREMAMLAIVIAMQVAIDLSLPQVSFAAHAGGFVAGLVVGLALCLARPAPIAA